MGADRFWRLPLPPPPPPPPTGTAGLERDPSEQVLDAGLGGGGIEAVSLSSFAFEIIGLLIYFLY